ERELLQEGRKYRLRVFHIAGMERSADVQHYDTRTVRTQHFLRLLQDLSGTGYHDLIRCIEVGQIYRSQRILLQKHRKIFLVESQHCGHGAVARSTHELAAALHEPQPGFEIERVCREQRVVFTQTVPGQEIW